MSGVQCSTIVQLALYFMLIIRIGVIFSFSYCTESTVRTIVVGKYREIFSVIRNDNIHVH